MSTIADLRQSAIRQAMRYRDNDLSLLGTRDMISWPFPEKVSPFTVWSLMASWLAWGASSDRDHFYNGTFPTLFSRLTSVSRLRSRPQWRQKRLAEFNYRQTLFVEQTVQ